MGPAMCDVVKLLIHLIQDFQPIGPFYTNILIEKKQFLVEEVSNYILPFYFYSSFATLTVCFVVIGLLGHGKSLVMLLCLQILMLLLVALMKPRALRVSQLMYALGGSTNVYKSVLRTLLVKSQTSVEAQLGRLKILRYMIFSFAAWLGQGIHNQTNNYNIIIALSLLSTVVAGIMSIFVAGSDAEVSTEGLLKSLSSPQAFAAAVRGLFYKELIIGLICGSSSSLLQIYLSIFSQAIFHEKAKDQQAPSAASSFFFQLIDSPIYYLSYATVQIFSAISPIFAAQAPCERQLVFIKSGYIVGTTKILASVISTLITSIITPENRQVALMFIFPLSILSFALLNRVTSVGYAKILYFATLTFIMSSEILGKGYIHRTGDKIFVSNLCIFAESLVHTFINYVCRMNNYKSKTKASIYTSFACVALASIFAIKFFC